MKILDGEIANDGGINNRIKVITATSTLLASDSLVFLNNGATNIILTLPLWIDGMEIFIGRIQSTSTGTVTIQCSGANNIESLTGTVGATTSLATIGVRGSKITLIHYQNTWIRKGND